MRAIGMRPSAGSGSKAIGVVALRSLLVLGALVSSVSSARAFGNGDVGTSGAAFLKIGPGARPVGMGNAFTGVADDVHAVYWNPAGLGTLQSPEITGMHMQYFQSMQYEFAAFAYPTRSYGTWALSVNDLHMDDIERRTADTDSNLGTFGSSDLAYTLSYGTKLSSALSVGGNLKLIRETIDTAHANAYAVDGGVLYDTGWRDVRVGAALQNLGTRIKFVDESDPLPLTGRLGASLPIDRRLLLSTDLILPRDHAVAAAVGGEYKYPIAHEVTAAVRAGYQSGNDVSGLAGVAAGGGLAVGRASFDFAWVPFGDLGNSYRFALSVKFGPPEEAAPSLQKHAAAPSDLSQPSERLFDEL